ncbi:MAG: T9SS type A sorting domain-containing protein [Lentisphaeria bacterium]|nr:T9SS type A sorting domain-containing protein [Candidatus Neomarinimicrobiota bacterium]MCF7842291.1 T9SS type A sorting domain-containing protein [Lentisphaeria bacterium]
MYKKVLLILVLSTGLLQAEFSQTNGPTGGNFRSMASHSDTLYGLTSYNTLFQYVDGEWSRLPAPADANGIIHFAGKLFSYGYSGVFYLDMDSQQWNGTHNVQVRFASQANDRLYVMTTDSVYHSSDGFTWTSTFDSLVSQIAFFGDTLNQVLMNPKQILQADSNYVLACTGQFSTTQKGIYVSNDLGQSWYEPAGIASFSQTLDLLNWNGKFINNTTTGLYISEDLGQNWYRVMHGIPTENSYLNDLFLYHDSLYGLSAGSSMLYRLEDTTWVAVAPVPDTYAIHPFQAGFVYSSNDRIYTYDLTTATTVDISANLVATSTFVLGIDNESALAYNPGRAGYFTQDNGVTWQPFPRVVTRVAQMDDELYFASGSGVQMSSDWGQTVTSRNSGIPDAYLPSINQIRSDNGTLYIGFSRSRARTHLSPVWEAGGIYKSTNQGASWTVASSGLPNQGGVFVPIYDFYVDDDVLIANTIDGTFRSLNGGGSWSRFENGLAEYERPQQFISYNGQIFTATYYGVKVSSPSSVQWEDVSAGLQDFVNGYGLRFVVQDSMLYMHDNNTNIFYQFAESGWEAIDAPTVSPVDYFQFSTTGSTVWAAVYDGGIWSGTVESITATRGETSIPRKFALGQNYPNPLNPETRIDFRVPEESPVTITIYNLLGQEVTRLAKGIYQAGRHQVIWNGRNSAGLMVPSGTYFYRLEASEFTQTRRMILLK